MKKNTFNHPASNLKKASFCSVFEETIPHVAFFWHPIDPSTILES